MCLQNNSKCYKRILIYFSGNIVHGTRNRLLDFGGDSDHCLHPVNFFKQFFIIALTNNIGGIWAWQRYVLSGCSCFILWVKLGVIKSQNFVAACIFFIFTFTYIYIYISEGNRKPYAGCLKSWSDLLPTHQP